MNLFKGFPNKSRTDTETETESVPAGKETTPGESSESTVQVSLDPLDSKLLSSVREMIKSREVMKNQIVERDGAIVDRDSRIKEMLHDKGFLERKIEHLSKENNRLQENVLDQKMQYEQILAEYTAHRQQFENKIEELQERLTERELTNRQLMFDLNRNQKDSELRIRELETREREKQVKVQHLEEKHKNLLLENERLLGIINDFASQASSLSNRKKITALES